MASLLLEPLAAHAIIIRHDRADGRYVIDERDYPQLFSLHRRYGNRVCVATLISPRWAITAAHCLSETPILETVAAGEPWPVTVAGRKNALEALAVHPSWPASTREEGVDLALLRLRDPVEDIEPARLYRETDEAGKVATFLGWGFTGTGSVGRNGNDGHFRRAQNRVSEAGRWLRFRFDDPRHEREKSLPLEGVPGLGDSGGPALLDGATGLVILGVAMGELIDPRRPGMRQGRYGAVELYERISSQLEWIEAQIGE